MSKFESRLKHNIDEWFKIRKIITEADYELIKLYTHKTENVK